MPTPYVYGTLANQGGPPVTMGPVGYWLDAEGNVAATDPQGNPQITPGMRDTPNQMAYDAAKDLYYIPGQGGRRVYVSPASFNQGGTSSGRGTGHGMREPSGGGMVHGHPTWNPETGTFDVDLDWGKVLSYVVAAGLTAGVADAVFGGAGAAGVSGTSSAGMPSAGADIGLGLPEAMAAGPGSGIPAAAGADIGLGLPEAMAGGPGSGFSAIGPPATGAGAETVPADAFVGPQQPPVGPSGGGLPSWLGPILGSLPGAVGGLVGTALRTRADRDAAALQQRYLEQALRYAASQDRYRQATAANRYANLVSGLTPFISSGRAADARMAQLLGLPAPEQGAPQIPAPTYPTPDLPTLGPLPGQEPRIPGGAPQVPVAGPNAPLSAQSVLLQSPDGSTQKAVPAAHVPYYLSRGATRVPVPTNG